MSCISKEFTCEFCNNAFINEANLKKHQLTAKYCLEIQNKSLKEVLKFACDYCEYLTGQKAHLTQHMKTCKEKVKKKDIEQKLELVEKEKEEYKKEKEEYKKEAFKPKKITNNNLTFDIKQKFFQEYLSPITNILQILPEEIDKRYKASHFLRGQEGCAELLTEIVNDVKKRYITESNAGNIFLYKDDEDRIQIDDKARLLIEASRESLEENARKECIKKINS